MPQYIVGYQATADGAGTSQECGLIALTTDSAEQIKIVRVRASIGTASATDACRIKFLRTSDLGSGSTTGTAVKKDPLAPASVTAVNIKNGATDWLMSGVTVLETIDQVCFGGRSMLEWQPIDDSDYIIIEGGDIFMMSFDTSTTASLLVNATVEWQEGR